MSQSKGRLKSLAEQESMKKKTEYRVGPEESGLPELGQGSWLVRITPMEFFNEVRSVFT